MDIKSRSFQVLDDKYKVYKEIGDGLQARVFLVSPSDIVDSKMKSVNSDQT